MTRIITLSTDFGTEDPYVGVMKGVILGINPGVRLVDLTHSVGAQQVLEGSFLLGTAFRYFVEGTIHLAVVDPGVGSSRRALAVEAGGYYFVAPDNGLLTHVLAKLGQMVRGSGDRPVLTDVGPGVRAFSLTNPDYWLYPVSSTFHGRDVFSPIAAHLSLGIDLEELGEEVSSLLVFPLERPGREGGTISGRVIHIDHFGNLVTDIRIEDLPDEPVDVLIAGRVIHGLSSSYADAGVSDEAPLLAIAGSTGYLDIAVRNGNAARFLRVTPGALVQVVVSRRR